MSRPDLATPDLATFVRQHAEPLSAALGLMIWGIDVVGGHRPVVRLFVETAPSPLSPLSPGTPPAGRLPGGPQPAGLLPRVGNAQGVDIEQCAELSRRLGLALEVADPFTDAWTLEVSSPGFERQFFTLQQLPPYLGRDLEITLSAPLVDWPGRKKFRGILSTVGDETVTVELDLSQRRVNDPPCAELPWDHVRRARLVHEFVEPEKPGKGKDSGKARAAEQDNPSGTQPKKRGPKIHDELD